MTNKICSGYFNPVQFMNDLKSDFDSTKKTTPYSKDLLEDFVDQYTITKSGILTSTQLAQAKKAGISENEAEKRLIYHVVDEYFKATGKDTGKGMFHNLKNLALTLDGGKKITKEDAKQFAKLGNDMLTRADVGCEVDITKLPAANKEVCVGNFSPSDFLYDLKDDWIQKTQWKPYTKNTLNKFIKNYTQTHDDILTDNQKAQVQASGKTVDEAEALVINQVFDEHFKNKGAKGKNLFQNLTNLSLSWYGIGNIDHKDINRIYDDLAPEMRELANSSCETDISKLLSQNNNPTTTQTTPPTSKPPVTPSPKPTKPPCTYDSLPHGWEKASTDKKTAWAQKRQAIQGNTKTTAAFDDFTKVRMVGSKQQHTIQPGMTLSDLAAYLVVLRCQQDGDPTTNLSEVDPIQAKRQHKALFTTYLDTLVQANDCSEIIQPGDKFNLDINWATGKVKAEKV